MHPVVKECLENAQALRRKLAETSADIPDGHLGDRLVRMERMLTYLLAALDYLACTDGERSVLYDTLDEHRVDGIGPDPGSGWPGRYTGPHAPDAGIDPLASS